MIDHRSCKTAITPGQLAPNQKLIGPQAEVKNIVNFSFFNRLQLGG